MSARLVNLWKIRAEAAEAALDRVRSITVEECKTMLDDWYGYDPVHGELAERIHRLYAERMEGE